MAAADDPDLARLRHVATLSELSLSPDEEQRFAAELARIVTFFAELDAIDTEGVPPTAHVSGIEPTRSGEGWRPDVTEPCLDHDAALAAAPQPEHGGFGVPSFVE